VISQIAIKIQEKYFVEWRGMQESAMQSAAGARRKAAKRRAFSGKIEWNQ
jgi:hypothetical protein